MVGGGDQYDCKLRAVRLFGIGGSRAKKRAPGWNPGARFRRHCGGMATGCLLDQLPPTVVGSAAAPSADLDVAASAALVAASACSAIAVRSFTCTPAGGV